jgi:broad specificity phosphatase PhoE
VTASTFIFVRHAESEDMRERLVGRTPGIGLTILGRTQAEAAARSLAAFPVKSILASPQQRARETAGILGTALRVAVESHHDLDELDFGDWTGLRFTDLQNIPEWKTFNSLRSLTRPPGGESLRDAQTRAVRAMLLLHSASQGSTFIVVTHADIIRAVLTYFSGTPLDLFLRFAIDPASATILQFSDTDVQILCVNRIA